MSTTAPAATRPDLAGRLPRPTLTPSQDHLVTPSPPLADLLRGGTPQIDPAAARLGFDAVAIEDQYKSRWTDEPAVISTANQSGQVHNRWSELGERACRRSRWDRAFDWLVIAILAVIIVGAVVVAYHSLAGDPTITGWLRHVSQAPNSPIRVGQSLNRAVGG